MYLGDLVLADSPNYWLIHRYLWCSNKPQVNSTSLHQVCVSRKRAIASNLASTHIGSHMVACPSMAILLVPHLQKYLRTATSIPSSTLSARLEYHPENAAPYDVLLGQFGRRIHLADPPTPQQRGATYFAETGHNLSGSFLAYWQKNGGLPQFGYPISEVFTERLEDGKPYVVQYFERARFEYHPENRAPNDLLLGQFGRRVLSGVPAPVPSPATPPPADFQMMVTASKGASNTDFVITIKGLPAGGVSVLIVIKSGDGAVLSENLGFQIPPGDTEVKGTINFKTSLPRGLYTVASLIDGVILDTVNVQLQ